MKACGGDAQGTTRCYYPRQTIVARASGDGLSPERTDLSTVRGATRGQCNKRKSLMIGRVTAALICGIASCFLCASVTAQTGGTGVVALTPAEMQWTTQGGLAAPGMEQLNLVGDPTKPGPYTLRLKFPKGFRIAPHTHPDSREVTIVSGTFATGYGETFDPAKLKILPAGSFYIEPANVPHYIEIKEDVILQVSGMGPSGRRFVGSPDGPK